MKRIILGAVLCLSAGSLFAQGLVTNAPIRMGNKLVRVGDSQVSVLNTAGRKPDMITHLQNVYGAGVGERWVYIEPGYSGRAITIEFSANGVQRLWSERLK